MAENSDPNEKKTEEKSVKKKTAAWKFVEPNILEVSDDSPEVCMEKLFSFKLTRYKDEVTCEESLKIESFRECEFNGAIITTPYNLENDITELKRYGVMFSPLAFRELRLAIEKIYIFLENTPISLADNRLNDLVSMVKELVDGNSDLVETDFCYVPVNQFNGLAEDCGYYPYEIKSLRSSLVKTGYTRKQGERYTVLHRINGKPERTIAFFQSKMNVPVPEKKATRTKTSDADEK